MIFELPLWYTIKGTAPCTQDGNIVYLYCVLVYLYQYLFFHTFRSNNTTSRRCTLITVCVCSVLCAYTCTRFCFSSAWLDGEDDPVITRVNQRIEDITALTVETAELLQVLP